MSSVPAQTDETELKLFQNLDVATISGFYDIGQRDLVVLTGRMATNLS